MAVGGHPPVLRTLQSIQEMDAVIGRAESVGPSRSVIEELLRQCSSSSDLQELLRMLVCRSKIQQAEGSCAAFYDAVIVFAEADRKLAIHIRDFMNKLVLENGEHPKVCLFDRSEFGGSEIKIPKTLIDKCSLIFPLLTDNFEHDPSVQFLNEETVADTRFGNASQRQQYCVRPLHTQPKRDRRYPIPFGLASIRSYDVYDLDSEHTQSKLADLIGHHLPYRKKREIHAQRTESVMHQQNTKTSSADQVSDDDDGQTLDLKHFDGRRSLPDEKATQTFQFDSIGKTQTSDNERFRFSSPSGGAARRQAQGERFDARLETGNTISQDQDLHTQPGTQQLSEFGLTNDYITMKKTNVSRGKSTAPGYLESVDLNETNSKVLMTLPTSTESATKNQKGLKNQVAYQHTTSDIISDFRSKDPTDENHKNCAFRSVDKRHEDPVELKQPLPMHPLVGNDPNCDLKSVDEKHDNPRKPQQQITPTAKSEEGEEVQSSLQAQYGSESLSDESRSILAEQILTSASELEIGDVEEDDKSCSENEDRKVPQALTDKYCNFGDENLSDSLINIEKNNKKSDSNPQLTFAKDPDGTQIQRLLSSSSDGSTVTASAQDSASYTGEDETKQETSGSDFINTDEQSYKETDGFEKLKCNDQIESMAKETSVTNFIGPTEDNITITEKTLMTSGPAYVRGPGLCAEPEAERRRFQNDETSHRHDENYGISGHVEEESVSSNFTGEGMRSPEMTAPKESPSQFPLKDVGTTYVYIYNSSDIHIQGENNIRMKGNDKSGSSSDKSGSGSDKSGSRSDKSGSRSDKSDSSDQSNTDLTSEKMEEEGKDPGWLPPHRQKHNKVNSDQKMITQGEITPESTPVPSVSELTKSNVSTADDKSSPWLPPILVKPAFSTSAEAAVDDNGGMVKKISDALTPEECKVSDDSSLNGSIPGKKKKKSRGCLPFRLKWKRKKQNLHLSSAEGWGAT